MPHQASADSENYSSSELAAKEKEAAATVSLALGGRLLALAWVLFVVGLFLPHGGSTAGWKVVTLRATADGLHVGIAETVFAILGTLGVVVCGGFVLITKRTRWANVAFLLTGMALLAALLGMWMRIQDKQVLGGPGLGVGFLMEVAAVIIATYPLIVIVVRRSDEQQKWATKRAQHDNLDEVGYAQRAALVSQQENTPETNPLLVDDRRQQAKQRHQKYL